MPPEDQAPVTLAAPPASTSEADAIAAAIAAAEAEANPPAPPPTPAAPDTAEAPTKAPTEPPPPVLEKDDPMLAEIARRERYARQQLQTASQMRQESQKLSQQNQELLARVVRLEADAKTFDEALRIDPFGALRQKTGLDTLDLVARYGEKNAQPTDPRYKELADEIASLKSSLSERDKRAEEESRKQQQQAQYQQALQTVHTALKAEPDTFEAIFDRGQAGLARVGQILATLADDIRREGYEPLPPTDEDIRAAAKMAEEEFRAEDYAMLQHKAERKYLRSRLTLGEPQTKAATPVTTAPPQASPSSPPSTLTTDLDREAPQQRVLRTDEERLAAALAIPVPSRSG